MTATTLTPTDLRSACEALAESRGKIRIQGAGTAAAWAGSVAGGDVVDATGLTGIHTYNPADMTVSLGAGTPLAQLQDEAARYGQRIAFDAARVRRGATVGGLIATADSGPLALGFGSLRDLVIGATVVLADGTAARTGGHVIKNVAGYDLAKLMHGSYGAYGLMTEVVLRLHPAPEAQRTVAVDCTLPGASGHTRSLLAEAQEPVSLEWTDGRLLIRIEGTIDGAATRARVLAELTGGRVLSDDEAAESWEQHARLVDSATVRVGCLPSRLPDIVERFDAPAAVGLATGVATLSVPPDLIDEVHDALTSVRGTSVARNSAGARVRPWGQQPSALELLRSIKRELDPSCRLDSGRFGPWLEPSPTTVNETSAADSGTGAAEPRPRAAPSPVTSPANPPERESAQHTVSRPSKTTPATQNDPPPRMSTQTQTPTDSGGTRSAGPEQEDS